MEIYLRAFQKIDESDAIKIAILLNLIGDEGIDLYNAFMASERKPNALTFEQVLNLYKKHCEPKKNVIYERFKFNKCV